MRIERSNVSVEIKDFYVYLIIADYDESSWVEGVFSTRNKAESALESLNERPHPNISYGISKWYVDRDTSKQ
jgi:uncharacterized protein YfcZ (UPF0381/DUF406 family)